MTPDAYTIREAFLDVGDGHTLYIHEWGNPKASNPFISLHGGPGDSMSDSHKLRYDPRQHRVIFFDQRGCGRSTPYGELRNNTTTDLVEDISKIADHCGVESFVLTGASWGSCLALAYAIAHPERVQALVINGIFTGSQAEISWLDSGQFRTFYPEAWQTYLEATPKSYRDNPTAYHAKRVLGDDANAARESAYAYSRLEGSVMALDDRFKPVDMLEYDHIPTRIELHYMANTCFMPDRYVLDHAHKLTMPVWIIQGRYDMVCPPQAAYELHQQIASSRLVWTTAGHRSADRETSTVLKTLAMQFS